MYYFGGTPQPQDPQLEHFLRKGYVVIPPCGTPQLHGQIYSKAWAVHAQDATWKLGDGVLGAIPELYQVLEAPKVKQTLSKVLGENYMLHGHRHLHVSSSNNQMWHKDSYWGFRKVRRHRPRWCMLLYYPQDTTVTMGPTCILSGSQYWTKDTEQSEVGEDILLPNSQEQSMFLPQGSLQHQAAVMNEAKSNYLGHHAHLVEDLALTVPAGSCVLMHYDLFHRASCRQSGTAPERFLVKFQFLRTMEPLPRPKPPASFRSGLVAVNPMDPVVEEVRSWLGEAVPAALASGNDVEALNSTNEADRLAAAYRLGRSGCHVPLLAALDEAEAGARAASYGLAAGLSALGAGALATEQRVLQLLKSPSTRTRRFSAFVLGEGAMPSMANVSALGAALREESAASLLGDDTRSEMLEALGLLGARARALGREELCTLCMLHAFPFLEQSVAPLLKTQAGESAAYAVLLAAGPRGAAPPQVLAKLAVAAATRNDLLMSNFAAEVLRRHAAAPKMPLAPRAAPMARTQLQRQQLSRLVPRAPVRVATIKSHPIRCRDTGARRWPPFEEASLEEDVPTELDALKGWQTPQTSVSLLDSVAGASSPGSSVSVWADPNVGMWPELKDTRI